MDITLETRTIDQISDADDPDYGKIKVRVTACLLMSDAEFAVFRDTGFQILFATPEKI